MCRGARCGGSSAGIWVFGTGSCTSCSTSSSPVAAGEKGPVLKFLKLLELSSERCALSSAWWLFPSSAQPNPSTSAWGAELPSCCAQHSLWAFFFVCPIGVKGAVVLDPLPPSPSVPPLRQSTASPGRS